MSRQFSLPFIGKNRFGNFLCLPILLFVFIASPAFGQEQAKKLIALLDYLGSDYKNAVMDGKVLSQDEYTEMQEFSKRISELFAQLKELDKGDKAGIDAEVKSLTAQVDQKADPKVIADLAKSIKDKLLAAYQIVPYPRRLPTLADGKKLYDDNCAQCHGATGKGDGPGRQSMNPKTPLPANFTDPERIGGLSPFKAFNTTSFGIEGTAMASFAALSEEQRWQVSFYVSYAAVFARRRKRWGSAISIQEVAGEFTRLRPVTTHSDEQLLEKLSPCDQEAEALNLLAYLRRGVLETKTQDPLSIARGKIPRSGGALRQRRQRESLSESGGSLSRWLRARRAGAVRQGCVVRPCLEGQFTQLRNAIKQGELPSDRETPARDRSEARRGHANAWPVRTTSPPTMPLSIQR